MKANTSNMHKQLNRDILYPPCETLDIVREKIIEKVNHRP